MRAASSANSYNMSFIDVPAVTGFIEASCIIGGVKRDIVGKSMRPPRVYSLGQTKKTLARTSKLPDMASTLKKKHAASFQTFSLL